MGGKRQVGWPSLLVTYLLATQEISDSAREAGRNVRALKDCKRGRSRHRERHWTPAFVAATYERLPERSHTCEARQHTHRAPATTLCNTCRNANGFSGLYNTPIPASSNRCRNSPSRSAVNITVGTSACSAVNCCHTSNPV